MGTCVVYYHQEIIRDEKVSMTNNFGKNHAINLLNITGIYNLLKIYSIGNLFFFFSLVFLNPN